MNTAIALKGVMIEASLADNRVCGGFDGSEFKADVYIVADRINSDGFVVDNQAFIDFVREKFDEAMLKASCEELCAGLINLAVDYPSGSNIVEVRARVYNLTGHVEAFWATGDDVPTFPRRATRRERDETNDEDSSFGRC